MTEQEKMIAGELYNPADLQLSQDRLTARELVFDLNQLRPSQKAEKAAIFQKLLRTEQSEFHIELPFRCDAECDHW